MRKLADGEVVECEGHAQRGETAPATGWCGDGLPWCDECGRWNMDIGQAVALIKQGKRVTRPGWNGHDMHLYLSPPLALPDGTVSQPVVMMRTADGAHVAWTCSQSDLLAIDWMDEDSH